MSSIDKLLIRGIRSFDPGHEEVVRFVPPLTLIVGHNGSGKTTIIECLKYATTGDLPPNSKGGAFVNDPKIRTDAETKAQVKLKFVNLNGNEVVVTRSLVLTQKKSTMTQKTLESAIVTKDAVTGEMISTTSRCMDVDTEIPNQLGVSRAILENVIFVHQEESNWPLSEPSILKKKFDEIFSATKYTKALQSIKDLRKEQAVELKLDTQRLEFLKSDKERYEKVKTKAKDMEKKIDNLRGRIEELDSGELATTVAQLKSAGEMIQTIGALEMRVNSAEIEQGSLQKQVAEIEARIEVLDEPDDRLQRRLQKIHDTVSNLDAVKAEVEQRKKTAEQQQGRLQNEMNTLLTKKGQLQAAVDAHHRKIEDRAKLVSELAKAHGFRGFEHTPLSEDEVVTFTEKLKGSLKEAEASLQQAKNKGRAKEQEQQQKLQELQNKVARLESTRASEVKQIDSNKTKVSNLRRSLEQNRLQPSEYEDLEAELQTVQKELDDAQNQLRAMDYDNRTKMSEDNLAAEDRNYRNFQNELSAINAQADTQARYGVKKQEKQKKEQILEQTLKGAIAEFQEHLKRPLNEANRLDEEINDVIRQVQASLDDTRRKLALASNEASKSDAELERLRRLRREMQLDMEAKEAKLKQAMGDRDISQFDQLLEETEDALEDDRKALADFDSMKAVYGKFIKGMKAKHSCQLCHRPFENDQQEAAVLAAAETFLTTLPAKEKDAKARFDTSDAELNLMRSLVTVNNIYVNLRDSEFPKIQQQLETAQTTYETSSASKKDLESKLDDLLKEQTAAASIRRKADDVVRIKKEVRQLATEVNQLKEDLEASGFTKTSEDLKKQMDESQAKRDRLRSDIAELNRLYRIKSSEINTKSTRAQGIKDSLAKIVQRRAEVERIEKEIEDLRKDISAKEAEVQKHTDEIEDLEPTKRDLERELEEVRRRNAGAENEVALKVSKLAQSQSQLNAYDQEIQRYRDQRVEENLKDADAQFKQKEEAVTKLASDIQELVQEANSHDKRASEQAVERRNIEDNIRLRRLKKELDDSKVELRKLREERAELDKASVSLQFERLKAKQEKLVGERSGILGELKQLEEQQKQVNKDMASDKNIEKVYVDHLITLKTKEMAHIDLEKYAKALDAAIMKYHSMKMDEINKIIKELWEKTYKGNDIQTIEIRADAESAKGNRSYNYRVVMIKDTAELDMRGRCSAGQKVLACIIIRLALAEVFCINCGILALDEPTTNLDSDNARGLAESLSAIVEERKKQANFQLIVITHDEEFMRMLGSTEHADFFYRISKDESGYPGIKKKPINSR